MIFKPLSTVRSWCTALALCIFMAAPAMAAPAVTSWNTFKFPSGQPACTGVGLRVNQYWDRLDCGFSNVTISDVTNTATVEGSILDKDGNVLEIQTLFYSATDGDYQFDVVPGNSTSGISWPAGKFTLRVTRVDGVFGNYGETNFNVNQLGGSLAVAGSGFVAGDAIPVTGRLYQIDETSTLSPPTETDVPASAYLQVVDPAGNVLWTSAQFTAAGDGTFSQTVPGSATSGFTGSNVAIEIVNASYTDTLTEQWAADKAGAAGVTFAVVAGAEVALDNSFVTSVGWVKPGDTYPWRVFVRNPTAAALANAQVVIQAPLTGTSFTQATPLAGAGIASVSSSTITWTIGTVPSGGTVTLVAEGIAHTVAQDPMIVWKDISNTATLTYDGAPAPLVDATHGPKVIPPLATYNTARFGDRPYVVVPVDYTDRKHDPANTGELLENKLNSDAAPTATEGSTFALWQEVSFGQLFPNGAVGSADIASADFTVDWNDPNRTDNEFTFSNNTPQGTCVGTDFATLAGTPAYPERISNGWYQLPRDTQYYGGDRYGTALIGALGGVGLIFAIDDACGPTGKAVYDAAHISDPEIDYNDYDTDKDGVVDFFMMVFVGIGGNGASQLNVPPYDNIWPHSSSLEFYFTDPATGLKGYVSDDQLKSLEEIPQCWIDNTYTTSDDCAANGGSGDDALPVYVRVGPYNVNPEDAIENASVISHEYGHSLGLPDFYCTGSKSCYGDWNLMATDKSHHMDVFGKQELGWVVPVPLTEGSTFVSNWRESKFDTGEIHWQTPDGTPYTLSAANGNQNIHNAEAYTVKLPSAKVIEPDLVANGASPDFVWWSGSGNDFGCPGHTFDFGLSPQEVGPGDVITIEFASWWEIEWDWDYGFTLVSTDLGSTYESLPSDNAYTTPATYNPNQNGCQSQYGNGLTGTSGSYLGGTDAVDRVSGAFTPATTFTPDSYTFTMPAGADQGLLMRLAYATDPAVAGRGWFVDNLKVSVNGVQVFYNEFEDGTWNARFAADGWSIISADLGSQADRGYYMEMRDRTGFDLDGNGENDRAAIAFAPGLLLTITDEVLGYGNTGSGDYPNQSPVDAVPDPGNDAPNLNDAAFTATGVSQYSDAGPVGWIDNYNDALQSDGNWHHAYDCLSFEVVSMSGTGNGPRYPLPGDLVGDVTFDIGPSAANACGQFTYWPDATDFDDDGVQDLLDNCVDVPNADQLDGDGDGVGNACDNCTEAANASQCDSDGDGYGNMCDADLNNSGAVNVIDLGLFKSVYLTNDRDADFNCNGNVNVIDLGLLKSMYLQSPGPSAFGN